MGINVYFGHLTKMNFDSHKFRSQRWGSDCEVSSRISGDAAQIVHFYGNQGSIWSFDQNEP